MDSDSIRVSTSTSTLNEISGLVVDAALDVHRGLGPGLYESVYQAVLAYELRKRGMHVVTEISIPVKWETVTLDVGFRADLIVEHEVIVELKATEVISPIHKRQLLTYLRLADKKLGPLINFGAYLLKDGIHRIVNKLEDEPQTTSGDSG